MENEVYLNGINLVRSVIAHMNKLDGVGLFGYNVVMDKVVGPGLMILHDYSTVLDVDGERIDVIEDGLDEEDFAVTETQALEVVMRIRELNRLEYEFDESSKRHSQRIDAVLVVAGKHLKRREPALHIVVDGLNGVFGEECILAKKLMDLYDEWETEDLGSFGVLLHYMLKIAREATDNLFERLEGLGEKLSNEQFNMQMKAMELRDEATDRILQMREDHLDWMDFPCNGDCASCDYFVMGGCEDDKEDEDGDEEE